MASAGGQWWRCHIAEAQRQGAARRQRRAPGEGSLWRAASACNVRLAAGGGQPAACSQRQVSAAGASGPLPATCSRGRAASAGRQRIAACSVQPEARKQRRERCEHAAECRVCGSAQVGCDRRHCCREAQPPCAIDDLQSRTQAGGVHTLPAAHWKFGLPLVDPRKGEIYDGRVTAAKECPLRIKVRWAQ